MRQHLLSYPLTITTYLKIFLSMSYQEWMFIARCIAKEPANPILHKQYRISRCVTIPSASSRHPLLRKTLQQIPGSMYYILRMYLQNRISTDLILPLPIYNPVESSPMTLFYHRFSTAYHRFLFLIQP